VRQPHLLSITGHSGSGKTTVASALGQSLNLPVLGYDDMDSLVRWQGDFERWLSDGANFEDFDLARLQAHTARFMTQHPVRCAMFDYPFGKLQSAFRSVIDLAIFIDTHLMLPWPGAYDATGRSYRSDVRLVAHWAKWLPSLRPARLSRA